MTMQSERPVELLCLHYNNGQEIQTWERVHQVGIVGGCPLVRRHDGMFEVIEDRSRIRSNAPDQKIPS